MHDTLNMLKKVGFIMVTFEEQRKQANKVLKNLIGLDVESKGHAEVLMTFFELAKPEIAKVLKSHQAYPYYLTKSGDLVSIFIVSNRSEEYEEELRLSQSGIVYAYVYNISRPEFSEFGTIQVDNKLRRVE